MIAHNYRLEAVFDGVAPAGEPALDARIQKELIQKIHSRDLGEDVDFLRGKALSDTVLLEIFWPLVAGLAHPACLAALTLESDARTRWTMRKGPQ